jgi:hypothetical protein
MSSAMSSASSLITSAFKYVLELPHVTRQA